LNQPLSKRTITVNTPHRIRYAIIGTGSRAHMYFHEITGPYAQDAELVAISDINPGRADHYKNYVTGRGHQAPQFFSPDAIKDMIQSMSVERVIVTSPDWVHAAHIVEALHAGADVIVEKPLTITADGIAAIAEAVRRTGRNVTVTFNYRYSPRNTALKQLIAQGSLGEITSVHFEWLLDTAHGADYFRRWHREKSKSGGLLIHKASHHFDLVNWWLADTPSRVFASGGLRFYGDENAKRRGLGPRPERGTTDSPLNDEFSLDLRKDPQLRALYLENEDIDGYHRDVDVFTAGITIEDNLSLVVDYTSGAAMSYSLNAHAPWEGYTVSINGTRGRAELTVVERGAVALDAGGRVLIDPTARPEGVIEDQSRPVSERLPFQEHFRPAVEIPIEQQEGGHGGGDARLLRDIFKGPGEDLLGHAATWRDGAQSVAVGLAGNLSLATGQAVRIDQLELGEGLNPKTSAPALPQPSLI
jgi:predicted dehydrogenase